MIADTGNNANTRRQPSGLDLAREVERDRSRCLTVNAFQRQPDQIAILRPVLFGELLAEKLSEINLLSDSRDPQYSVVIANKRLHKRTEGEYGDVQYIITMHLMRDVGNFEYDAHKLPASHEVAEALFALLEHRPSPSIHREQFLLVTENNDVGDWSIRDWTVRDWPEKRSAPVRPSSQPASARVQS